MRRAIADLQESQIREVANAGLGRSDVLPFWFGESDEVTPEFIRQAAMESLQRGETFYGHNLGLPEFRQAIADYLSQRHGPIGVERLAVTAGGVNALMLAMQALLDPGDEVVAVTPVWPNLTAQPVILGAQLRCISLVAKAGAWTLDMASLLEAVTPATKLLIVNSPNNPTGWTLSRAEQQQILAHCRNTGTWILADEVYERLYYGEAEEERSPSRGENSPAPGRPKPGAPLGGKDAVQRGGDTCAPSFLDIAQPQDRLVVAHSCSKSFLMTGWRLGWLVMPPRMTHGMGKLIEFNTSCSSVFTQRAAVVALQRQAEVTPALVLHLKNCRDTLVPLLQALPGLELALPVGGMYAFFRLQGVNDTVAIAKQLVQQAGLGLAPGEAFSPHAAGWLRWCFASRDPQRLVQGVERLKAWLGSRL